MRKLTEKQVGKKIIITKLSKNDAYFPNAEDFIYGKIFKVVRLLRCHHYGENKLAELKTGRHTRVILNSLEYKLYKPEVKK